jgi:hypothetical protein
MFDNFQHSTGVVRENVTTKTTNDAEIIPEVKNWLRHAPQRAKSKT